MKLPETASQGRIECPDCGGRLTEITSHQRSQNKKEIECGDCQHEFTIYTGPECPKCNSNHTKERTTGVSPHRYNYIACFECPYDGS